MVSDGGNVTEPAVMVKFPVVVALLLNVHPPEPLKVVEAKADAPVSVPEIVFPVAVELKVIVPPFALKVPFWVKLSPIVELTATVTVPFVMVKFPDIAAAEGTNVHAPFAPLNVVEPNAEELVSVPFIVFPASVALKSVRPELCVKVPLFV